MSVDDNSQPVKYGLISFTGYCSKGDEGKFIGEKSEEHYLSQVIRVNNVSVMMSIAQYNVMRMAFTCVLFHPRTPNPHLIMRKI